MMKNSFSKKFFARVLSILIVCLIYFSIFNLPLSVNAASNNSDRVIVSLGDSFSSGEGIEPFYDQDLSNFQKVKSFDWLAHRSEKSWPGMLTLKDKNGKEILMSENRNVHWYFAAASGAETKHINNSQDKPYNKNFGTLSSENKDALPSQLSVFYDVKREYKKVDYVTLTLGGNDVGFTEVIETVAKNSFYVTPNKLSDLIKEKIDMLNENIGKNLMQAYKDIYKAAGRGAQIIVAGYPQLFCSVNANRELVGELFSIAERIIINNSVNILNYKIQSIIEGAGDEKGLDESIPIHYVSVKEEFDGHEAYSLFSYINPVYLTPKPQDLDDRIIKNGPNPSSYSMHPNENGAKAYARCVQKKIDELEKEKSNKKPTSTDEYFYQLQQYNMQHGLPLAYDENTIYFYGGITEYGNWVNGTADLKNLEKSDFYNWYGSDGHYSFCAKTINVAETPDVHISLYNPVVAISEKKIYYERVNALYRNPIYFSDKTESKNFLLYYDEEYCEESISYTDEIIFDAANYGDIISFVLSEQYIYIYCSDGEIIRMCHDGSEQTVIMTRIGQSDLSGGFYTFDNDLYFVCDGVLYCNYEDSAECTAICEIAPGIELVEALGDVLYFRYAEIDEPGLLVDSYNQIIYKYTPGDTKLTEHASTSTQGSGDVFVDPNGVVLFVCGDEGAYPTYHLEKGVLTDGFYLHMDYSSIFVYKNSIYGVSTDGKNLVPIHEF